MSAKIVSFGFGFGLLALVLGCRGGGGAAQAPSPPASPPPAAAASAPAAAAPAKAGRVTVQVTEKGFVPDVIPAQAGQPVTLAVTRKTDQTCARELVIAGKDGKTELPLDKEVEVTFTPKAPGKVPFGCAMGMMVSGTLDVK